MKIKTLLMLALIAFICLSGKTAETTASTVVLNSTNQADFKITITKRSVSWPKGVVEFRFECPAKLKSAKFDGVSLDLLDEKKEFYFRSPVAAWDKHGAKVGFFMIQQSKIKDCVAGISYVSKAEETTVYIVDLSSYANSKDSE